MSEKKFDDKIRETLEGHEPDVQADWGSMKERIAAAAAIGAITLDVASSKLLSQLSIGAAVIAGAATMWFAERYVFSDDVDSNEIEIENVYNNDADILIPNLITISEINEVDKVSGDGVIEIVSDWFSPKKETDLEETHQVEVEKIKVPSVLNDKTESSKITNEILENNLKGGVDDKPKLEPLPFIASSREACVGIQVDFALYGSEKNMSFLWNFGDGSFSSDPEPTHTYNEEGVFDVTLSVRSPGDGTIRTRTIENLIEVHPQPEAVLKWELPRIVSQGSLEVKLLDETKNTNSSVWVVDGNVADNNHPEFIVPGSYHLNLIASNKFGCQDHASETIKLGDRQDLKAPARFSPDGDGRYDTFMPFGLYNLLDKWEMVISDNEGNEVFVTNKFSSPWRGIDATGNIASNGTLFNWTVRCTDHSGVQRLYFDVVSVER